MLELIDRPTRMSANDSEDMVVIDLGMDFRPRIAYQTALELAQYLRMACKSAARFDHANGHFWSDVPMEDLNDCPTPHRGFRRSAQAANVKNCEARYKGAEVVVLFDDRGKIMGYEDGIRLHQCIRRAGRRAKAWAGDTSGSMRMLANLTDAAEDDRLGI